MEDGIDHINIYSKGKTSLGRKLSNFARFEIDTEDGKFQSVEGYWYWLGSGDDKLRTLYGFQAKDYGRKLQRKFTISFDEFKRKIKNAIKIKIEKYFLDEFLSNRLPYTHYYVYHDRIVKAKEQYIIDIIDELYSELLPF